MASAYATLAAGGIYSKPMAITRVVLPNGKADTSAAWGKPKRERVIPDWVAATVTRVLQENMVSGTGRAAHIYNHTDAGKTGTTDNYADAWFSGYTPRLEATVWIGYPSAEIPMLNVHGIAVSGPTFPAQIWHTYMGTAIGNRPDVPFPSATGTPSWTSWHGQYEYSGAYGYTSTTATGSSSTTTSSRPSATTQTQRSTTTAPPPATTTFVPPPATTTVPPATTTEPTPTVGP
jgi:penicillin-binding protein 1A